jgi:hypothetical protein
MCEAIKAGCEAIKAGSLQRASQTLRIGFAQDALHGAYSNGKAFYLHSNCWHVCSFTQSECVLLFALQAAYRI